MKRNKFGINSKLCQRMGCEAVDKALPGWWLGWAGFLSYIHPLIAGLETGCSGESPCSPECLMQMAEGLLIPCENIECPKLLGNFQHLNFFSVPIASRVTKAEKEKTTYILCFSFLSDEVRGDLAEGRFKKSFPLFLTRIPGCCQVVLEPIASS